MADEYLDGHLTQDTVPVEDRIKFGDDVVASALQAGDEFGEGGDTGGVAGVLVEGVGVAGKQVLSVLPFKQGPRHRETAIQKNVVVGGLEEQVGASG